ncbi:MAG: hypothetical protein OHK005_08750 [Candidatus Methylacidiphilales bacterium]
MNSPLVRWVLLLVLLLVLIGGGIFAYFQFFQPSNIPVSERPSEVVKPLDAADFLPAETVAFLRIPNAPQTMARLRNSPAFALLSNPGVVESWKNAGTKPGTDGTVEPAWEGWPRFIALVEGLENLANGEGFIAVTEVAQEGDNPRASAIAGLQVKDDEAAVLAWLEQARALDPDLDWKEVSGAPHSYFTAQPKSDNPETVLCAARLNNWIFFGIGPKAFEAVLARAADSKRQPASLKESPLFKEASVGLPDQPDFFSYVNVAPILPWLNKLAAMRPAPAGQPEDGEAAQGSDPASAARPTGDFSSALQPMKAVAMTTTISQNDWLDGLGLILSANTPWMTATVKAPLSGVTFRFLKPDALLCAVQNTDFPQMLDQIKTSDPEMVGPIDEFTTKADAFLASAGITFQQDILNNLGPETATSIEWAPGNPIPTILMVVQHRKQEPLKKAMDLLAAAAANFGAVLQVESKMIGQDPAYSVSSPLAPVPPLVLYLGPDVFVLGFNAGTPETVAGRKGPGLVESSDYLALRDRLGPPPVKEPIQILYVDLRRLYANLHGAAQAYLPMIPGVDASQIRFPTPDQAEPFLGRLLWLGGMEGDRIVSSAVTEKVHPVFLLAASVGWLAEVGTLVSKKPTGPTTETDGTFEAEILEMEATGSDPSMTLPLPGEPEPIFDNVPSSPGGTSVSEP